MQTWCITHHTACCPDRPKGTILLEAKTHRGCVATREGVRVGLSGPQLVPGLSSTVSKFLLIFCLQLIKVPRNTPVKHHSSCADLPSLLLPFKPQASMKGWEGKIGWEESRKGIPEWSFLILGRNSSVPARNIKFGI